MKIYRLTEIAIVFLALFAAVEEAGAAINITSPKPTDTLLIGSTVRISWTGAAKPVNVYYSDGSGKLLIDKDNALGFVDWTLPGNDSLHFAFSVEEAADHGTDLLWGVERAHDAEVRTCCISPDGKYALTAGRDGLVKLWNIDARKQEPELKLEGDVMIYGAAFLHSSDTIIVAFNNHIAIYNRNTKELDIRFWVSGFLDYAKFIEPHPTETRVALGTDHGILIVLNLKDMLASQVLLVPGNPNVYSVRFSPDGNYLIAGADDGKIYRYDWRKKELLGVYGKHEDATGQRTLVWSAASMPDNSRIVSGGADNRARVWNVADSTQLANLDAHSFYVRSVDISANGKEFLTASLDSTLRLWDASTYKEISPALNHNGQILFARYSSSGDSIITCGRDSSFKIWSKRMQTVAGDSVLCPALYPLIVKAQDCYAEPGEQVALAVTINKPFDTELNRKTYPKGELTLSVPYKSLQALPESSYPEAVKSNYNIKINAFQTVGSDTIARLNAKALVNGEIAEQIIPLAFELEGDPVYRPILNGGIIHVSEPCRPKEELSFVRGGKTLELESELVQNLLRIYTYGEGAWELSVFDASGNELITRRRNFPAGRRSEMEIDVSGLPGGVYFVRLAKRDERAVKAFLIAR